jgi:hypothetical protein
MQLLHKERTASIHNWSELQKAGCAQESFHCVLLQFNATYKKDTVNMSLALPSNMYYFYTTKYQQLCKLKFLYYHNAVVFKTVWVEDKHLQPDL